MSPNDLYRVILPPPTTNHMKTFKGSPHHYLLPEPHKQKGVQHPNP